jgi:hypothetical protein
MREPKRKEEGEEDFYGRVCRLPTGGLRHNGALDVEMAREGTGPREWCGRRLGDAFSEQAGGNEERKRKWKPGEHSEDIASYEKSSLESHRGVGMRSDGMCMVAWTFEAYESPVELVMLQ